MIFLPIFYLTLLMFIVFAFANHAYATIQSQLAILLLVFLAFTFCMSVYNGVDWLPYIQDYYGQADYPFEVGYKLISGLCAFLGIDFWIFSGLVKLFVFAALYVFIKRQRIPYASFIIAFYVATNYHPLSNFIRQDIAIGLSFIASGLYLNDRRKSAWLTILLASTFHLSVLCFAFIFYLVRRKYIVNVLVVIFPVLFILALLKISLINSIVEFIHTIHLYPYLTNKLSVYFAQDIKPVTLGYLGRCTIFLLCSYALWYMNNCSPSTGYQQKSRIIWFSYVALFISILVETIFFQSRTIATRMALYTNVFVVIVPILLLSEISTLKRQIIKVSLISYIVTSVMIMYKTPFFHEFYASDYNNYLLYKIKKDRHLDHSAHRKAELYWLDYKPM